MATDEQAGAAIAVRGLDVIRGDNHVLHGVTLDVPAGKITGLLGPSGCGKSTLMRSIVGVQRVASGTVTVLGLPAGSPALRSRVGYVTQAPSVYGDLTVRENLRYFSRLLGMSRAAADEMIDRVALADAADRTVARLSGGQQARVSLATALVGRPELLVLDEPTVGLDPVLRRDLWSLFRDLAADGVTLLVSSHVMDEAERCDDLLLLRNGRLIAAEPPGALLARTASTSLDAAFLRLVEEDA